MPVGVIGGALAATGAVAGAAISGNAAQNAANTAAGAAAANNALESQIYGENSANEKPFIAAGDNAETALQGFLGLGGNPAASQAALNDYLNSTGYQFNLNQGLAAVTQSKAAAGELGSGSTLEALDKYATGEADQYGQQYEGDLAGVVNTGAGAANALAGQGENYAGAVSANNNSAATTAANAGLAGASNTNALIGNAIGAYGKIAGATSFGGGAASGNAFSSVPYFNGGYGG